jgi:hypothetical protein
VKTLYLVATSERPDPYINTLVHTLSLGVSSVTIVVIGEHEYDDEREESLASTVLANISTQLRLLAAGRYLSDAVQPGRTNHVRIGQDDAKVYARCLEHLNQHSVTSVVVPLYELDDRLKGFISSGPCIFDVSALKKKLLVDVVALLLSNGFSEVYSFELLKSPTYDERDLIHALRHEEYVYRNLTDSAPVRKALERVTSRYIRFRTMVRIALILFFLIGVPQILFADSWLTRIFGSLSAVASIASFLFFFVLKE